MTTAPAVNLDRVTPHRIVVARLAVAGGLSAAAVLLLCWLGTLIPYSNPTHAYISLFTTAPVSSVTALVEGLGWSLLFGALAGGVFAVIYNLAGAFEPR